jgi:hypothetical protein
VIDCAHERLSCLNQYELIRKYRCDGCGGVMICACDKEFGARFLSHQLKSGRELELQIDVPVDLGFVSKVCPECRGLPPIPAPVAAGFGRTSKIKRYYWRELYFLKTLRQAEWSEAHPSASPDELKVAHAAIEADILQEVKAKHASSPKYSFSEPSQEEILKRYEVDVQAIGAIYSEHPAKGALIRLGNEIVSPEAYVTHLYQSEGWSVMPLESVPLHALFGVMMWLLIQDGGDPRVRMIGFGDRHVYEASKSNVLIWTLLPDDFGGRGYAERRKKQIAEHFELFSENREDMLWQFDYWRTLSSDFRQYLWAHREVDVDRARLLLTLLKPSYVILILRYLVSDYWGHYLGWPDLLLVRDDEILLVEVKSSGDRLSNDQKRWIADNAEHLKLPFRLVKLHRKFP